MTIEELLEALPSEIYTKSGNFYCLQMGKDDVSGYYFSYEYNEGYKVHTLFFHKGSLKDSLEAVYQDLKDNNLL